MDPQLYRGAQAGNWEVIRQFENQLSAHVTSEENTVLHILAQFCDSSFAAEQILAKTPNLLLTANAQGEISLHIAARNGHFNLFRKILDCAKDSGKEYWPSILRIRNKNGNLALHEAVQYNQHDIVLILLQEDPTLIHFANNVKESPLYLAVEKGNRDIASLMFSTFELVSNDFFKNDARGWTPLHYAARIDHQEMVRKMLDADTSMAYVKSKSNGNTSKHGGKTALHITIIHGHIKTTEDILSYCPDCWEMITDQGKNLLHLAVENEQKEALDFIMKKPWVSNLINQKDPDGNTPLHLYAAMRNNLLDHPEADWYVFNNARLTPQDFIRRNLIKAEPENYGATNGIQSVISSEKENEIPETNEPANKEESEPKRFETIFHTHIVVSILILTISFAAAFTVPGAYNNETGRPVLFRTAAFKAFIICDAISVMFSMVAVLCLLLVPHGRTHLVQENSGICIIYAILTLLISFVTGLYASIPIWGIRIFLILILPLVCVLLMYYVCTTHFLENEKDPSRENLSTTSPEAAGNGDDKS